MRQSLHGLGSGFRRNGNTQENRQADKLRWRDDITNSILFSITADHIKRA